jgi:uncharacterized protein (DUF2062 family)
LRRRSLWRFNQRSVARGVAIGLFFGILTPVAQAVFAVIAAVTLRANLVVAVCSTLITNPFTFYLVYRSAYLIGAFLTGRTRDMHSADTDAYVPDVEASAEAAERALDVGGWWSTLVDWVSTVGPPLIVGIIVLALCVSLVGFLFANVTWIIAARVGKALRQVRAATAPAPIERRSEQRR